MPLHSFSVDLDQNGINTLVDVHPSFRSDVEQRYTPLAVHNIDSADIRMARLQADEIINVSGGEVYVYVRTDNADHDAVWDEDADPTYWNKVSMKAYFKPAPLEAEMKKWGVDTLNKMEIIFSHRQLYEQFGERMIRPGDVIKVQYNAIGAHNPKHYRVLNAAPSGNHRYIWLYYTCHAETLAVDINVRPTDAEPLPPQYDLETNGTFRESL